MPLKILIYCRSFHPAVGGIETLVAILASEFHALGHEVRLVNYTPGLTDEEPFAFEVVRFPSALRLLSLVRWCDVYFHPQQSLRGAWPLAIVRRPWVVSHNTLYCRTDGRVAWQDNLKQFLNRFSANISVSKVIAAHVRAPSTVIHNTYRQDVFRPLPGISREPRLIFVGRLVSEKGVDVMLDALGIMAREGRMPRASIVGAGPELTRLQAQAEALGIAEQVAFLGLRNGEELARTLHAHTIMVMPSRWEAFGIAALEGIACGCAVVASDAGGLPDAVGNCGLIFPRDNARALADCLALLLDAPETLRALRSNGEAHLARYRQRAIAAEYLTVFASAAARSPRVRETAT